MSHGEAYLPHEKGGGAANAINREASENSSMPNGGYNQVVASKYVSRFLNLKPATSDTPFQFQQQPSGLCLSETLLYIPVFVQLSSCYLK